MLLVMLRLFAGLCLLGSLFLSVTSVASHTWSVQYSINGTFHDNHMGLWRFCDSKKCTPIDDNPLITKNKLKGWLLFVRALCCFAVFANLVTLSYFMFDCMVLTKRCHLLAISSSIFTTALSMCIGMTLYTDKIQFDHFKWGWSHTLGWFSSLLLVLAFFAFFYYAKIVGKTIKRHGHRQEFHERDFDYY